MNRSSDISIFSKTLFFVMGLLVAAFVVSQEVIDYHCSKLSAQVEDQESSDSEESETEIGMLSCEVVLPGSSLTLEPFTPIFIREIILEEDIQNPVPQDVPLNGTQHFKTLFRQFISPNAP